MTAKSKHSTATGGRANQGAGQSHPPAGTPFRLPLLQPLSPNHSTLRCSPAPPTHMRRRCSRHRPRDRLRGAPTGAVRGPSSSTAARVTLWGARAVAPVRRPAAGAPALSSVAARDATPGASPQAEKPAGYTSKVPHRKKASRRAGGRKSGKQARALTPASTQVIRGCRCPVR